MGGEARVEAEVGDGGWGFELAEAGVVEICDEGGGGFVGDAG